MPIEEFNMFLEKIRPDIQYTTKEEIECLNLVEYLSQNRHNEVNLVQYVYWINKDCFTSDVVLTAGFNDNGRLGIENSDYFVQESRDFTYSEIQKDEEKFNLVLMKRKDRIETFKQVSIPASIKKVSCGHKFTLALDVNGTVWAWGQGVDGCLGNADIDDKFKPTSINPSYFGGDSAKSKVVDIAAGAEHCLAINSLNEAFSWGKGKLGRLGHGTETALLTPKIIEHFLNIQVKVIAIAAGEQHSACITDLNKLYTWGCGANYRLGHGHIYNSFLPQMVLAISDYYVTQVSCGSTHTLCLTNCKQIYTWGSGLHGRLGVNLGNSSDHMIPTRVGTLKEELRVKLYTEVHAGPHQSFALTEDGELLAWGSKKFKTLGVSGLKIDLHMPTLVDVGSVKFYFKKQKNQVKVQKIRFDSYDLNFKQKFHSDDDPFSTTKIFCGELNTVFLMANGDIYVTGSGQHGQLCIDPERNAIEFDSQPEAMKEIFAEDEILYSHIPIYLPINLEVKFKHVSAGLGHIIAISTTGKAYAWGRNADGQLGFGGSSKYVHHPTVIEEISHKAFEMSATSHTYSALLSETGDIWVFGSGEYGCLGVDPVKQNYEVLLPRRIKDIPPMKYIAAGPQHMASITTNGELYTWGNLSNGRLGLGEKGKKIFMPQRVPLNDPKYPAKFRQVKPLQTLF